MGKGTALLSIPRHARSFELVQPGGQPNIGGYACADHMAIIYRTRTLTFRQ
jgi:hypothetical protein